MEKCLAIPIAKGATTRQLKGICAAEGYRGVSAKGAGQCRAATPFRPCPLCQTSGFQAQKGKAIFFPLNSFLGLGRLLWGLPKPCCRPNKLLTLGSINYALGVTVAELELDVVVKYLEPVSISPQLLFPYLSLTGKEPWLCCQRNVFLV